MESTSSDCDDVFQSAGSLHSDNVGIGVEAEVVIAEKLLHILSCFQILRSSSNQGNIAHNGFLSMAGT